MQESHGKFIKSAYGGLLKYVFHCRYPFCRWVTQDEARHLSNWEPLSCPELFLAVDGRPKNGVITPTTLQPTTNGNIAKQYQPYCECWLQMIARFKLTSIIKWITVVLYKTEAPVSSAAGTLSPILVVTRLMLGVRWEVISDLNFSRPPTPTASCAWGCVKICITNGNSGGSDSPCFLAVVVWLS